MSIPTYVDPRTGFPEGITLHGSAAAYATSVARPKVAASTARVLTRGGLLPSTRIQSARCCRAEFWHTTPSTGCPRSQNPYPSGGGHSVFVRSGHFRRAALACLSERVFATMMTLALGIRSGGEQRRGAPSVVYPCQRTSAIAGLQPELIHHPLLGLVVRRELSKHTTFGLRTVKANLVAWLSRPPLSDASFLGPRSAGCTINTTVTASARISQRERSPIPQRGL